MSEQTFQKTDNTSIVRRDSAYACLHPVLADAENCTCEVSSTRAPPTQRASSSPSIPPTQPEEPIADTFENLQTRTLRIADETFRNCVTPRLDFYLDELNEYNFSRDQNSSSILEKMAKMTFGLSEDEFKDAQEGNGYTGEPLWDASLLEPGRLPLPKEEEKSPPEQQDEGWWKRRTKRFKSKSNLKEAGKEAEAERSSGSRKGARVVKSQIPIMSHPLAPISKERRQGLRPRQRLVDYAIEGFELANSDENIRTPRDGSCQREAPEAAG